MRAPLAGVSALLVVSLFLGASLNAAKPALGSAQRETMSERAAVRQLTASLAKAVRQLVGSDQHKPCLYTPAALLGATARPAALMAGADAGPVPSVPLLRAALLDLPPPARA